MKKRFISYSYLTVATGLLGVFIWWYVDIGYWVATHPSFWTEQSPALSHIVWLMFTILFSGAFFTLFGLLAKMLFPVLGKLHKESLSQFREDLAARKKTSTSNKNNKPETF